MFVAEQNKIINSFPIFDVFVGIGLLFFHFADVEHGWVGQMQIIFSYFLLFSGIHIDDFYSLLDLLDLGQFDSHFQNYFIPQIC